MLNKNFFLKYKIKIFITSIVLIILSLLFPLLKCNISYENVPDMLRTGLHPVKPPFSNIYHGNNYRFPYGSCTESQCHYRNLTGGNSGSPSCYSCHSDLWTVFSISHTYNVKGRLHHYAVENGNFLADCGSAGCHGNGTSLYTVNLTGYNYRYACYSCHNPIPPPGHIVNKEGVLHHKDVGQDPHVYCYKLGCHGATEPGRTCSRCHSSDYPTGN